ncbi:RNA polymerase sigma-70 factor [Mariniphaga sediminis]|uniref:RNA polymerase sigma-70 factor n=2 Tax=Mariniphaga sediminis TaxID=1628158 RepID=A0A399D6F4_9BACT|nr:RNA polymerase sigma-70 factor [Mariniphaga sediminis]
MNSEESIYKMIRGLIDDDKKSFDDLYFYYYPKLYAFSKTFLKVEDDINDILQEVFIKTWDNRKKIKDVETFNAWIFTITKNSVVTYFREKIRQKDFESRVRKMAVGELVFNDSLEYKDLKERVDQLVEQLPEKRKMIFKLSREKGLSNREIAKKLEISIKTVEDHMLYSLRFLRNNLKDFEVLTLLYISLFL